LEFRTCTVEVMPEAPGMFTTLTGCPSFCTAQVAINRASLSCRELVQGLD